MKNVTTKAAAKVAAVATGLAMATSMLSFAPMVHAAALTSAQVSGILSLLSSFGADSTTIANVNASLTGTAVTSGSTTTTTGTSACTFSRNLTIGSTGADVTCLQNGLIAGGFSIPAGATGYFGTQTRAAVASWQSSRNVAPAVGYFGAISRAAWNLGGSTTNTTNTTTTTTTTTSTVAGCAAGAVFSATTGAACTSTSTVAGCAAGAVFSATTGQACSGTTTVTTGALTGTGRLTSISSLGDVTSDLKEGDAATQVAGFSAVATGGDVSIQRVDVRFDILPGTGSSNLDAYVSDVSLWLDGKKIASMDPALGDKSTGAIWDLRFTGLNGVIKSGQTGNLYVKVTPLSSINSLNTGATAVSFLTDSVRAVGADGISDTYSPAATGSFTVTAVTTGTLVASLATDNPAAGIVAVASSTTAGVNLLSLSLKAKNSAVTVTDLGASIGVSSNTTVGAVVSNVKLMKGSTVLKTGTINGVTTGQYNTVTFSGVDQTIAKDATGSYWISVDLKADTYPDGATIIASTTDTATLWDVSDASGNTVTPSVAVTGNTMTLTATGISVVRGTPTATVANGLTGKGDIATFTIPFTVTAGDSAVYIGGAMVAANKIASLVTVPSAAGVNYSTTTSSTLYATQEPVASFAAADTNTNDSGTSYYVAANTSRTFTLTAAVTASSTVSNGFVGIILKGINYSLTSTMGSTYYTSNLTSFKTADVYVSLR